MKKFGFLVFALAFASSASAFQFTSSGPITMANCGILNEDVRLNLSTGVAAGVACNEQAIVLSACHTTGKVSSRSVPVKTVAAANGIPEHLVSCTVGTADPACAVQEVKGPAVPTASTRMGTVNSDYPGGDTCTAAGAESNAQVALSKIQ